MIQDNLFLALRALFPQEPELVGDVTAVHSDGTVTVQLPGGGVQRVRGVAETGDAVFFKAGVITGPAPDLTALTIEE